MEEDVTSGPARLVPKPVRTPMLAWRNIESLRRLAFLAERRAARRREGRLSAEYDAVVVGAGPNGLAAANHLADAGWSVLVLEAQPEVGGAVRSARDVHPDFVHDTFSSFYPLAAASPALLDLDLERYGVVWRHAPAVLGHPMPDGRWALLHRDREVTAGLLDELHPGDGEGWLGLCSEWDQHRGPGPRCVPVAVPAGPRRARRAGPAARGVGGLEFVKTLLTPAADLGARAGSAARRLASCSPATPGTPTSRSTPRAPG